MKGYKVLVTLERTLYIEDTSKIEMECIQPLEALSIANKVLKGNRINIPKLDLKDWSLNNIKYEELNENPEEIQNSK